MRKRRLVAAATLSGLLLAISAIPSNATFAGPNGRISFTAIAAGGGPEIFSSNPDGSDPVQLTHNPKRFAVGVSDWSPDGTRIAYDSDFDVDGRKHSEQVWVMNSDGSGATQLTRGPGFHGTPSWSPDGSQLAIDADWGDPNLEGVWVIPSSDADGVTIDEAVRIVDTPHRADFDSEPQFSPDGESIIFTRFRAPEFSAIFRVGTDGTNVDRLTRYRRNASDPDYSPDGTKIVFDSGDAGALGSKGDIWVMHADGSREHALTDTPPITQEEFVLANNPVWSPNGQRIMFTQFFPHGFQLVVMHADGSKRRGVIASPDFINKADWGAQP